MNQRQKQILLVFITLIFISTIFVPTEFHAVSNGNEITSFQGFKFITNIDSEISIKIIIVEWVGIVLMCSGLFKYFED